MKLQSLTIIFIIIILPVVLVLSAYIGYEIKTIEKQNMYNTGIISATHDAIFSFEINSKNDKYSNNAQTKRDVLKSAVKTFENSLSVNCNLGIYGNEVIEEYIPALVFGMYDGFYIYAPERTENKHELKNYIYYSEHIKDDAKEVDIIINYSLDNFISIVGTIQGIDVTKSGYLTVLNDIQFVSDTNIVDTYKGVKIEDSDAKEYFRRSAEFTWWVTNEVELGNINSDFNISSSNDPEKDDSKFVQHKRKIIKEKIESLLNASITAYANKTSNNYKMPKLSEGDWEKIYNNISVIGFVQGMNLGFKKYNNYCVLNSTNNQEYVNKNLIYFIDSEEKEYHDIRCHKISDKYTKGYKIGDFEKSIKDKVINDETGETKREYEYKHDETACYECINGFSNENINNMKQNVYDYVENSSSSKVKKSYYEAVARERLNTTKLLDKFNEVLKTADAAIKSFEGEEKTKLEVLQILYEIYNKYSFRYAAQRTIFIDEGGNNSCHFLFRTQKILGLNKALNYVNSGNKFKLYRNKNFTTLPVLAIVKVE